MTTHQRLLSCGSEPKALLIRNCLWKLWAFHASKQLSCKLKSIKISTKEIQTNYKRGLTPAEACTSACKLPQPPGKGGRRQWSHSVLHRSLHSRRKKSFLTQRSHVGIEVLAGDQLPGAHKAAAHGAGGERSPQEAQGAP